LSHTHLCALAGDDPNPNRELRREMMNLRGCLFDTLAAKERAEENERLAYQRKVDAEAEAEAAARKSRVRACGPNPG